ncbi:hypothetical protein [Streptomyces badius]
MPTSPTPADRPTDGRTTWPTAEPLQQAADLRRAAGDPLLADWLDATANALAWLAPYRDNEPGYGMWEAALAVARQLLGTTEGAGALDDEEEFGEPVCVDECGSCDVCGYEVFGTPAEGWREAARFLRRTPRDSADFSGALRGARLIEDELRRRAEAHDTTAAPPAPADRAAVLAEVDWIVEHCPDHGCVEPETAVCHCEIADRLRRLADGAAAGVQPPATTADRAAALGMTPTEYRQHSHTTAVQQIQAAAQGLFAGTAIRVADALKEPPAKACTCDFIDEPWIRMQHADDCPAAPAAPEEPTPC